MLLAVATSSSPPAVTPTVAPAVIPRRVTLHLPDQPRVPAGEPSPPPYSPGSREGSPTPARRMGESATPFPMMINRAALRKQIRDEGFASKDITAELQWRLESRFPLVVPFATSIHSDLYLFLDNAPRTPQEYRAFVAASEATISARPPHPPRPIGPAPSVSDVRPYSLCLAYSLTFDF